MYIEPGAELYVAPKIVVRLEDQRSEGYNRYVITVWINNTNIALSSTDKFVGINQGEGDFTYLEWYSRYWRDAEQIEEFIKDKLTKIFMPHNMVSLVKTHMTRILFSMNL